MNFITLKQVDNLLKTIPKSISQCAFLCSVIKNYTTNVFAMPYYQFLNIMYAMEIQPSYSIPNS